MWSWFNNHKYSLFQKRIKINSRCEGYISVFLNYFFQDKYFSSRFEIKDLVEVFLPFFLTYFRYLNSLNEFARTISSKKFFQFLLIEIRSWKKFQLTVSWISWKLTLVKLISMVKREREREFDCSHVVCWEQQRFDLTTSKYNTGTINCNNNTGENRESINGGGSMKKRSLFST